MSVIHFHVDSEKLIAAVSAEVGEGHAVVAALRDVFARCREQEERAESLARELRAIESRLDRSNVRR